MSALCASPYLNSIMVIKMKDKKTHWENIYSKNMANQVSWFQSHPSLSMRLIETSGIAKDEAVIDVGAGESHLVDHLLAKNFTKIAILDISSKALEDNKLRMKEQADKIEWIESDVTRFQPQQKFALWHDRAVFHFLTAEEDRLNYLHTLKNALIPDGHLIIATFTIGGPKQCSGLDIVQYDSETLCRFFGKEFELKETEMESHRTPWGAEQKFIYCRFRRNQGI